MNNVVKLRTEETIHEEASLWIARLDRELTDAEQLELRAWLNADERHHQAFLEMAELWDRMDVLSILADVARAPTRQRSVMWFGWIAAAMACAVLWLMLPQLKVWFFPDSVIVLSEKVYTTKVGQRRVINLADKSILTLNTNSSVIVTFTNQQRLIQMQRGELHIHIAPEPARPFSIYAANRIMQATDAALNLFMAQTGLTLTVLEGDVLVAQQDVTRRDPVHPKQVALPDSARLVSQGQFSDVATAHTAVHTLAKHEIAAQISWQQGKLMFNGEPLVQAMAQVSRYSDIDFRIADQALAAKPIVGVYRNDDVAGILFSLQENFAIAHEWLDNHTIALRSAD